MHSLSLSVRSLTCVRGERTLFTNLDLQVTSGEWLHIRGENGIGKTSLLRILAGLSKPATGEILWGNQSIFEDPSQYHRDLLFLGHRDSLKEDLTAFENLSIATALDGVAVSDKEILQSLHRFGLRGREELPVNCLSAGQKRRVLLARLLLRKAKLWILDEPFNALDVNAVEMLSKLIAEHIANDGIAILTSHQTISIAGGRVVQL
ncbi:cytochrome c biogenesis heme-transporting ATPase CcmA [Polynucleobacter tropicus]|uniref:Cytochrome c biogenesis heme-transporting ATPase CcmA n=1 Tax=Polynucleobacter tropicus TaxID=1743174 RepID=A0A6M9PTE6_9BURK|nr:cytochrome c biogenesis heme-transporting ATPase CcmA [Polynucleobacter tropicus]